MVASRDIEALELILFDTAAVVGPRRKTDAVCLDCGKSVNNNYTCGICTFPMCGELCQVGKTHQQECVILRSLSHIKDKSVVYQWISPLRLLLRMASNPRIHRQIKFLLDHNSTSVEEDEKLIEENRVVLELLLRCEPLKQFTMEDLIWIKGILNTNCIMFGEEESRALFPHFSLMNHSCRANAKHTIYTNNKKIAVQAQTDIKEGEEIVINYVTFIQGTHLRREKLKQVWKFDCVCDRCKDPTELNSHLSSLKCGKCENGFLIPDNPLSSDCSWVCNVHNYKMHSSQYLELVQGLKNYLYTAGNASSIPELETNLGLLEEHLHPHHHLCMMYKRKIISGYSKVPLKSLARPEFLRIRELCQESLQVLGLVDPGFPLWKSETLKDLGTCEMNLARTDFESGLITRPEFILRVKGSMKIVEQASNCKSSMKIERKLDTGEPLKEEK